MRVASVVVGLRLMWPSTKCFSVCASHTVWEIADETTNSGAYMTRILSENWNHFEQVSERGLYERTVTVAEKMLPHIRLFLGCEFTATP